MTIAEEHIAEILKFTGIENFGFARGMLDFQRRNVFQNLLEIAENDLLLLFRTTLASKFITHQKLQI